jgi:hypothetical protein
MPTSAGDPLEPLREALRQRGYLDRGLDRMILRSAGSPRGWLGGSIRAGLLSGIFLGLSLLLVLLLSSNPPLTTFREILLLALYLTVLSCLLLIAFEGACTLGARLLGNLVPGAHLDAGRIARGIGASGALAAALSLSFWWRGRGSEAWGIAAQIAALGAILAFSLLIGRVTSLTALLSVIHPGRLPAPRVRPPRSQRLAVVLLLVLVGTLVAVPWGEQRSSRRRAAAPSGVVLQPRKGRILWIGIDGLGEDLFRTLQAGGHLAFLAEAARDGCRIRIPHPAAEPPAVWVSAATGFPPIRHGVRGVETSTLPGIDAPMGDSPWLGPLLRAAKWMAPWLRPLQEVPVSGIYRRDKTVWEILGEQGIPSYIVNWWATWPADQGPGVRITERAFFRLETGGAPDREVFPPEDFQELRSSFGGFLAEHAADPSADYLTDPERLGRLMDVYHLQKAGEGWRQGRWPMVAVYLNGSDLISAGKSEEASPADQLRRARLLLAHFDFLDGRIAEISRGMAPQDLLVLEGDPGRARGALRDRGILLLRGGGILRAGPLEGDLLDVAPTLLRLAGFPLSGDMTGRPAEQCLDSAVFGKGEDSGSVPSYGERRPPDSRPSDFDPEVLNRLRSLGYIR